MREENYFKAKLQNCKDTLQMAKSSLEHFDIQIANLELRFEHDKKVYNDRAIHMQNIVEEMEKRIPKLEKQIEKGYVAIDMRTGKGYKSFEDKHIAHLEAIKQEAIDNYEALKARFALKQELKEKRKAQKLKPEEKQIVEAAVIQESLQSKEEIEISEERQLENLMRKKDAIEAELTKIKREPIEPPKIVESPHTELEQMKEISEQIGKAKADINGNISIIEWLEENRPEWIEEYSNENEGKKAIWQGRVTDGFHKFMGDKGYRIGD